jgi:hypothetical protein
MKPVKFEESLEPIGPGDYEQNRKEKGDIVRNVGRAIRNIKNQAIKGADEYLGAISTQLGNINPKLGHRLRKLDQDVNLESQKDVKGVEPLLKKAKKMSKEDRADWDYARKNSDAVKINELIQKYDLAEEYETYRKTLDKLREDGIDVGMEIGLIEEYAPRVLKDSKGFLKAMGKEEDWPIYQRSLQDRAQEMGIDVDRMTAEQKADLISNMIAFGPKGLGSPGTKQRKLKKIPAKLNKYYMDSDAALMSHIYSMRKAIEARKFFGKVPEKIAEIKRRKNLANKKLQEFKKKGAKEKVKLLEETIKGFDSQLNAYENQRDFRDNIGQYIFDLINKGEISAKDQNTLHEILTARFQEKGMHGLLHAYKNLSYIDTMGSPISALTQIGDLAWALYDAGIYRTIKGVTRAAVGKSKITREDIGIERIAQEFMDPGSLGKAVSRVFKMVGLEKIDAIGKETLLNASLEKYQKKAKKSPNALKREIRDIFEGETDQAIQDLQNGDITDNVKLLVYNKLADFQPVGLSEMPQKYLTSGNGKIFYMLKTFTLKQFDVYRREVYNQFRKGGTKEKIKAARNFIRLSMFFVLANASADELKDWVLGRKTDLNDRVVDNLLRLMGVSKFVTWKARTEGLGSALVKQILPPFKFIDAVSKDIIGAGDGKGLEMLSSLPVVGKLAYWHLGRGREKRGDLWDRRWSKRKAKLTKVYERYERSKNKRQFTREHKKELDEYYTMKSKQGRLNTMRSMINRLKGQKQTPRTERKIEQLEKQRQELIQKYLER